MSNEREIGEWFYDCNDDLIDRLEPLLKLLGAEKIDLKAVEDPVTKYSESRKAANDDFKKAVLDGILKKIHGFRENEMEYEVTKNTITRKSAVNIEAASPLVYLLAFMKSGSHTLYIQKAKEIYSELHKILKKSGFEAVLLSGGAVVVRNVSGEEIAYIINVLDERISLGLLGLSEKA